MCAMTKFTAQEPGFAVRYVELKPALDTIDLRDDWKSHILSRKLVTIAALPFASPRRLSYVKQIILRSCDHFVQPGGRVRLCDDIVAQWAAYDAGVFRENPLIRARNKQVDGSRVLSMGRWNWGLEQLIYIELQFPGVAPRTVLVERNRNQIASWGVPVGHVAIGAPHW